MGNAVWLFWAVPYWYFSTLLMPFGNGPLSEIPALGAVCLIIGAGWGIIKRKTSLLIFLLLIVASQALVVVAGFSHGLLRGTTNQITLQTLLGTFLLLQIVIAGYFVWRLKGARLQITRRLMNEALPMATVSGCFATSALHGKAGVTANSPLTPSGH